MLTYSLSDRGPDSLYQYLYKCIKNDITGNVLAPGTRLPSKRNFAKNLGISTITVENAYAQLQAEGYIYSLPKKGFFVSSLDTSVAPVHPCPVIQSDVPSTEPVFADFGSNQMNAQNFPFSIWSKLIRETISNRHEELMSQSPCNGIFELRAAIAGHLKDFRNMSVSPEQIVIGAGTEYLYGLLIQLLGYDKIYAVENPGYHKISRIYQSHHVSCIPVTMDKTGIHIQELEECHADIAHISPSHHFPTGVVTPIGTRYELLGWASKSSDRYIIEDDYDSEFRLTGKPIPPLQSIDMSEKVIYMNTFTKTLSSTIRISYMVLPPSLLVKFRRELGFYSCTVSNFEQYTLARFIQEGYFEKHINRMRNHYRELRDALLEEIKKSPLASSSISEEDAGLHFLLHFQTSLSDAQIEQNLSHAGIRLSCLSQYYYHTGLSIPEHILVINYSGLQMENIPSVVSRLADALALKS